MADSQTNSPIDGRPAGLSTSEPAAGQPLAEPEFDRCMRCNRRLTNAKSRREGMGPVCRAKVEADRIQMRLF
jgi:uncharacterized protein with PIN domain